MKELGKWMSVKNMLGDSKKYFVFDSYDRFDTNEIHVSLALDDKVTEERRLFVIVDHPKKGKIAHELLTGPDTLVVLLRGGHAVLNKHSHGPRFW